MIQGDIGEREDDQSWNGGERRRLPRGCLQPQGQLGTRVTHRRLRADFPARLLTDNRFRVEHCGLGSYAQRTEEAANAAYRLEEDGDRVLVLGEEKRSLRPHRASALTEARWWRWRVGCLAGPACS